MKIWHRISSSHADQIEGDLQRVGVKYKKTPGFHGTQMLTVQINESDSRWPDVSRLFQSTSGVNLVWTEYTTQEILGAEYLMIGVLTRAGLLEHLGRWESFRTGFGGGCSWCSVGDQQTGPLEVGSELGLRTAFATVGTHWPLLASRQAADALAEAGINGFDIRSVLSHKTGQECERLVQLYIPTVAGPALVEEEAETERFRKEVCATCAQPRYTRYGRGMMPVRRSQLVNGADLQLTNEWFGTFHAAQREIIVSNRVARLITDMPASGIILWPLRLL